MYCLEYPNSLCNLEGSPMWDPSYVNPQSSSWMAPCLLVVIIWHIVSCMYSLNLSMPGIIPLHCVNLEAGLQLPLWHIQNCNHVPYLTPIWQRYRLLAVHCEVPLWRSRTISIPYTYYWACSRDKEWGCRQSPICKGMVLLLPISDTSNAMKWVQDPDQKYILRTRTRDVFLLPPRFMKEFAWLKEEKACKA